MNRYFSYLKAAQQLISLYKKGEPLHLHLKKYFANNKQMGSRDRRTVTDLCYAYFRLQPLLNSTHDLQHQMLTAAFICGKESKQLAEHLHPEWVSYNELPDMAKMAALEVSNFDQFPFFQQLSSKIRQESFCMMLLQQPKVFMRVRPGFQSKVMERLHAEGVSFEQISAHSLAVPPGTSLDQLLKLNKEVVIQDNSSQQVFDFVVNVIRKSENYLGRDLYVWDVCAASGGKSILFYDLYRSSVKLTVSDVRENILRNLVVRMTEAGINLHRKFCSDITVNVPLDSDERFDLIICDVPCSGSGTWARTPEQYAFYEDAAIAGFSLLQRKITLKAAQFLEKNGWLVYITCSAFAAENENNMRQICETGGLVCIQDAYLEGHEQGADTMYYAILKKKVSP